MTKKKAKKPICEQCDHKSDYNTTTTILTEVRKKNNRDGHHNCLGGLAQGYGKSPFCWGGCLARLSKLFFKK
jgi:hypothetical protein